MEQKLLSLFLVVVMLFLASCGAQPGVQVVQAQTQREVAPAPAASELTGLVDGNGAFALDLYRILREEPGNLFYSPYSISLALAMTYAGARGETEQQMAQALRFMAQDRLHPAFNGLDQELARRGEGAKGKDGKGFRLNIVNALWGQTGFHFEPDFLDVLARNYGAGLRLLDFERAPDPSRITINEWVEEQTEGKIVDLLAPGVIDDMTRLVLTNAIYFNAAWANPFKASATADGPFHLLDGKQVTVPMMRQSESFRYAEGEGYQAVELPYDGYELAMLILLPRAGEFEAFEETLDAGQMEAIMGSLQPGQVVLTMPKFEFESSFYLKEALGALGMAGAFDPQADFSGMTGKKDLYIGDVVHKAFVAVDEEGTEAAAATAVVMRASGAPAEPVEFTADRPFLFVIRDLQTGTILFVGRVVDPAVS